jgi:four helix bundle protein
MGSIRKFEDIRAWGQARALVKMVYQLTGTGSFSRDVGFKVQFQRAAVSAMTNIAEGFDCDSQAEFARFLGYSRRSAVEVQSLLYAALDADHIDTDQFESHYEQARKVKAMVSALKKSLRP